MDDHSYRQERSCRLLLTYGNPRPEYHVDQDSRLSTACNPAHLNVDIFQ